MNTLRVLLFLSIALVSCATTNDEKNCSYHLSDLLMSNQSKVVMTQQADTLFTVRDNIKDSVSFGLYFFDKKKNLISYAFYVNSEQYRYSEEFDSNGNLIKAEGTPLVEYRIWKKENDTVLFNAYVFSLYKRFQNLEVISNMGDTILPSLLYESDFHANVKCFSFKLPVAKKINDLKLYARGDYINTCTNHEMLFRDTVFFKNVRL